MKKASIIFLTLLSIKSFSQKIKLIDGESVINVSTSPTRDKIDHSITLSFLLTGKADKDIPVNLKTNFLRAIHVPYEFNEKIVITKSDWPDVSKGEENKTVKKEVFIKTAAAPNLNKEEEISIVVEAPNPNVIFCDDCNYLIKFQPDSSTALKRTAGDSKISLQKKGDDKKDSSESKEKLANEKSKENKYTICIVPDGDTLINPIFSDSVSNVKTLGIHLRLTGKNADLHSVKIKLDKLFTPPKNEIAFDRLVSDEIEIDSVDWPVDNPDTTITKQVFLKMVPAPKFSKDQYVYISLQDSSCRNNYQVRISTIGMYNPNKPFWIELGANFDLLDGLQANNLYGGVYLYKRDIRPLFGKNNDNNPEKNNLAVVGGVYESRSVSQESTAQLSPLIYFNPEKMVHPAAMPDSFYAYFDTGHLSATTTVTSTGLFFSPQVRLTNGSANRDGFHVFASLWMEMVWQRYKTSYDYSQSALYDSILYKQGTPEFNRIGTKPQDVSRDVRSHYFGIGLPMFLRFNDANLYFNQVFGLTNQLLVPSSLRPADTTVFIHNTTDLNGTTSSGLSSLITPKHNWNAFYLFQFRLSEEKYGISFTGEIRGVLLKDVKPVISLALSKKFDLSRLLLFE